MKKISLLTILFFCYFSNLNSQGLVLNEFSNGPAGSQEFFEYVVIGSPLYPNCGPIDIRNWIIDDNNGDFSCGSITGAGIAQGHVKFANNLNWSAVPTGSIILVYNDAIVSGVSQKNPAITLVDDPTDSNNDLVYVLPISSALFEKATGTLGCPLSAGDMIPLACNTVCPGAGTTAYLPSTYSASGNWDRISLANADDACQVRQPSGAYFHGVGYGGINLNGGPDNIFFAGSGNGSYYAITNSSSFNFRLQANWSKGLVSSGGETPGFANNASNLSWILSLQEPCPLPIVIKYEDAYPLNGGVVVEWNVLDLKGSLSIEKSLNSLDFEEIYQVDNFEYEFKGQIVDYNINNNNLFYRISLRDQSGEVKIGNVLSVFVEPNNGMVEYYDIYLKKHSSIESDIPKNQLLYIKRGNSYVKTIKVDL